jgi:ribosome-binding factor A
MSFRVKRFSSTLRHSIADIMLNEVNDPRLKSVIIKDVQIDDDLRKAQIFVSSSTGIDTETLQKLNHAKGFFKRNLVKKMYLKYVPDLTFIGESKNEENG